MVVAVLVAFTISLELTVLVTRSVLQPVDDLLEATEAVKHGDLDARVPITSGDELGRLAGSFNEMMQGLSEREALREAFGAYVDPDVAERVLEEGELIEGQEREVTVLILDVVDFTAFAQRASARETVAFLNDLFGIVVPCVTEHGGHANKFLGDGLLAVFGAPERLEDHADRAVAAAADIATKLTEQLRRRAPLRHRRELRPGGGGFGGRRRAARVRRDRRHRERGRAGGAPHARDGGHDARDRGHALPAFRERRPRAGAARRLCAERRAGTCADLCAVPGSGQKFEPAARSLSS